MVQEIRTDQPTVHRLPENSDLLLRYCLELEDTVTRQAADLTALRQMLSSEHDRHEHALRRPRRESVWAAFRRLLHDQFSPE
jgi:hypothetical protein